MQAATAAATRVNGLPMRPTSRENSSITWKIANRLRTDNIIMSYRSRVIRRELGDNNDYETCNCGDIQTTKHNIILNRDVQTDLEAAFLNTVIIYTCAQYWRGTQNMIMLSDSTLYLAWPTTRHQLIYDTITTLTWYYL